MPPLLPDALREHPPLDVLRLLADTFRPAGRRTDSHSVHTHWQQTLAQLQDSPALAAVIRDALLRHLNSVKQVPLYTDSGVPGSEGFFTALGQRLGWKLLPPARRPHDLKDQLSTLFPQAHDPDWLLQVSPEHWQALFDWLVPQADTLRDAVQMPLLDALAVLACRIAAMGLEPELVQVHPAIEEHDSPFLALNREAPTMYAATTPPRTNPACPSPMKSTCPYWYSNAGMCCAACDAILPVAASALD